jgi:serine/threonine-protein kinase
VDQGPDWQVPGYEDVQELGRGGFGRVVLARRLADGMPVAVKYLAARLVADPGFRADFRQEARMLAGLQSPHTVRLYDYVETGGEPATGAAIVMEYVPGASLRKLLASAGGTAMPPQAALGILKGSLLGLGTAHGVGVVHRDYKPENVLVRPEGTSVLADFGIAVRAGDTTAEVVGTLPYMAPEQFAGAWPSATADVYAATAVFFECVTGRRPIDVDSRDMRSWAYAHGTHRVPVEMAPAQVQELIARGLAKDPAQRPGQALAFAAELERTAVQAYGPDWERIGLQVLVGALTGLAATGVLLSLVPGLIGPALPIMPVPAVPAVPPVTPVTPPVPGIPPGPPAPAYPSAPQSPYPHPHPRPRVPRHHPWRHLKAKLGAGKAIATAGAAVVTVSVATTAVVLTTTQKPKSANPVVAVPTTSIATSPAPGPLVGDWVEHGGGLSVKPDGTFTIFVPISGTDGTTHASGRLATTTGTTADGEITQSDNQTHDDDIELGPVRLTLSPDNDTVEIKLSDAHAYTFCGPKTPPGVCTP